MTIGPFPLYRPIDAYAPARLLYADADAPLEIEDSGPIAGDPLDLDAPLPVGTCPGCGEATAGGETCPDCVLRW